MTSSKATPEPSSEASAERLYGGLTSTARKAQRRDRLTAAAFHLFGTKGFGDTTIEALCAEAAVGIRAFYEEFGSRDALFTAVYFQIADEAFARLQQNLFTTSSATLFERFESALSVYFHFLLDDPRRAQIMSVDTPRGDMELAAKRIDSVDRFAKLAEAAIAGQRQQHDGDLALWSTFMIGGVRSMVIHWMNSSPRPSVDELASEAARFLYRSLGG